MVSPTVHSGSYESLSNISKRGFDIERDSDPTRHDKDKGWLRDRKGIFFGNLQKVTTMSTILTEKKSQVKPSISEAAKGALVTRASMAQTGHQTTRIVVTGRLSRVTWTMRFSQRSMCLSWERMSFRPISD